MVDPSTYIPAVLSSFVVGWHLPSPRALWTAFQTYRSLKGAFPMNANPIALMTSALKLGEDAVKLYTDITQHDKAGAIAATLDALPAVATLTGEPLADLQAVVTADSLGDAWELEQDFVGVLPLVKAALAKYRGT